MCFRNQSDYVLYVRINIVYDENTRRTEFATLYSGELFRVSDIIKQTSQEVTMNFTTRPSNIYFGNGFRGTVEELYERPISERFRCRTLNIISDSGGGLAATFLTGNRDR